MQKQDKFDHVYTKLKPFYRKSLAGLEIWILVLVRYIVEQRVVQIKQTQMLDDSFSIKILEILQRFSSKDNVD